MSSAISLFDLLSSAFVSKVIFLSFLSTGKQIAMVCPRGMAFALRLSDRSAFGLNRSLVVCLPGEMWRARRGFFGPLVDSSGALKWPGI